jgi:hypothetical protein
MTDLEFFEKLTEVERVALLEFSAIHVCGSDPRPAEIFHPASGFNELFLNLRDKLLEHRRTRRQNLPEL